MMSKVITKQKVEKLKCRGDQYHHTIHTKGRLLEFCKKCNSYTDKGELGVCYCCRNPYMKSFTKNWKVKVLRAGFRQHSNTIRNWSLFPTKDPFYVEILYKTASYEIPIKYLALFIEASDLDEQDKIEMISKHLKTKGFRFSYPEVEETDVACHECGNLIVYDLEGKVFCKFCNDGF